MRDKVVKILKKYEVECNSTEIINELTSLISGDVNEPKKAKEILSALANDIIERKKLPTRIANVNSLKYDSVDVIEAMIRYGQQFNHLIPSEETIDIIQNLMAYSQIHTVEGIRYGGGTHKEYITKAQYWLNENRR